MALSPGIRIGPYEILAAIGAGGMGEVYRARDTKLGRELAIKVLPAGVSMDPERLHRFEQEARSASALNHPNIATIYEIGRSDATSYIAMELVAGRTLRDLLGDGPLPIRRFLAIAAQVADGLARAHDAGIVHRDLKPENVMVTREGTAKILDFGLAKLVAPLGSDVSNAATVAAQTHPGLVLGTLGYMSPEQASGRAVDSRADQFSFGALLYELATARRPFTRNTGAETLAAIIRDEPEPLQGLAPQFPVALRWVIERCLAKDPDERYASTRDLARDLAHLRDHVSEVSRIAPETLSHPRRRNASLMMAAGWLVAAGAIGFALTRTPSHPSASSVRFTVPLPDGVTYAPSEVSRGFSVSPDGSRLVIEAYSKTRRHLYLRRLDSEEFLELEGSIDATAHFWSPDSRSIAFFADGRLKKIPAGGGRPQDLCAAPFSVIGTWNSEGTILFTGINPPGIYRVQDTGGEPVPVTTASDRGQVLWPQFLPDGQRFLYVVGQFSGAGARQRSLHLGSLDKAEDLATGVAGPGTSRVEYLAPGFLLYARDGALFSQPFDQRKVKLAGELRQLAANVHYFYGPSHAAFSASNNGVIAYQTAAPRSRLTWFTRDGKEVGQLGEPAVVRGIRISPDGTRAAMDVRNNQIGSADIWVTELGSGVSTRQHSDSTDEVMPVWSPDSSTLFYRSDRTGPPNLYNVAVATPGSERLLLDLPGVEQPEDVTADGNRLAFLAEVATTVWNIFLLPLGGDRKPAPWAPTRFNQMSPRFSPDGRWIAFQSDESDESAVYVAMTEGGGQKRRISPTSGREPRWRADGREMYYVTPDGFIMSVAVTPGVQWSAGAPVRLFRVDREIENYDVSRDGSRFLIVTTQERIRESPLRVILNATTLFANEK